MRAPTWLTKWGSIKPWAIFTLALLLFPIEILSQAPALGKEQWGWTIGLRPSFLISSAGVKLSKRLILNTWSWHSLATSQNRNVKGFLFSSISRPCPGSLGLIFWCQITTNKGPVGVGVQGQLTLNYLTTGYQRDGLYSTPLVNVLHHGIYQFPCL